MSYGYIQDQGEDIDEVLVSKFQAPRSFTGEDVVEISCHGSSYVQRAILSTLQAHGCRMAAHGEFTQRAFLNKKMDLSQAEAVGDLIASESKAAHRLALNQMKGGFKEEIGSMRNRLIEFASLMELELDFSEEDVEFANRDQLKTLLSELDNRCDRLVKSFRLGNVIKEGIPVTILGAPNSGKSTLLNSLLQEERAIVSDIAGTTRDAIEARYRAGGFLFRFIDTAGIRETEDVIEAQGVDIAFKKASEARIILFMVDASDSNADSLEEEIRLIEEKKAEDADIIILLNKIDLTENTYPQETLVNYPIIRISALQGAGLDELESRLVDSVEEGFTENLLLTNQRHYEAFVKVRECLSRIGKGLDDGLPTDLITGDMRMALFHLGEITGEITTDDLLGSIFSKFCIGK